MEKPAPEALHAERKGLRTAERGQAVWRGMSICSAAETAVCIPDPPRMCSGGSGSIRGATGARYTRSRPPVELAYTEAAADRAAAQRREAAIKKLPRTEKLKLVETGQRALQKAEMRSNGA